LVITLVSHTRGPRFEPRLRHSFCFLTNSSTFSKLTFVGSKPSISQNHFLPKTLTNYLSPSPNRFLLSHTITHLQPRFLLSLASELVLFSCRPRIFKGFAAESERAMDWGNVTAEDLIDALREVDWSSPPRPLSEFFSRFTVPRSYAKWNSRLKCNLY
jgi:hypothetical protein